MFHDVSFRNITARDTKWAARMEGLPEATLQRLSFENINMETGEGVPVKWVEEILN